MATWLVAIITSTLTILASSGFWGYLQYKSSSKTETSKLMLGITYHVLQNECIKYLHTGSITSEEYNEIYRYLYEPYKSLGGNGSAERLMRDISQLPTRGPSMLKGPLEPPKERL